MLSWIPQHDTGSFLLQDTETKEVKAVLLVVREEACYIHKPSLFDRNAAQQIDGVYYPIIIDNGVKVLQPESRRGSARGVILRHFGLEWVPTLES